MTAAVRDSSLDYRTYWLQGGQYYSRRALGDAASCTLPADKLQQIPEADRKVLLEEVNADPAFCARVARCMATNPNWGHVIAASAKEAIANEMDPSKFPSRAGMWPKLRARARFLVDEVSKAMAQGKTPVTVRRMSGLSGLGSLGQWDIIASLVGTIGSAAVNIYGAGVTSRAQIDAQRDQANTAIAMAQAQMNAVNAANAMQAASNPLAPVAAAVQSIASATVAGIPVLALAIPAIGLIIYFATKK